MTAFLGLVLDRHKTGLLARDQAIGCLASVVAALDRGDIYEVRGWIEEGRDRSRDEA